MDTPTGHRPTDSLVSVPLTETDGNTVDWDDSIYEENSGKQDDGEAEETDEYMTQLLARLEQENNALAIDPKARLQSPSPAFVSPGDPNEPPPMKLMDFWLLVTKDYPEALRQLPTITPHLIRAGVPYILRSAVWVALAGARDAALSADYDRYVDQYSPCESTISKDLARTYPNIEMFKDPEGHGQKSLGRVLRCYSLYDPEIGYCQGMGFVVGALLMNMPERDAFCILVRLMRDQGLRTLYLPSLSGLHSRIYQFKRLLSTLSPTLVDHFQNLGVELAYLSQWFLTIFATTCPLEILFRIYDVMLAESANEVIMCVALAVILRNEAKLLEMTELEDVVKLLLSNDLWEEYEGQADRLIEEVTTVQRVATREVLEKLHERFIAETEVEGAGKTVRSLGFGQSFQLKASKFLDGLWAPSTKSASLSPEAPQFEGSPGFLRRSASKQSLATLNSISGASGTDTLASTDSYTSTAPTEIEGGLERRKSNRTIHREDKRMHEQVEDLLLAMSEVQRQHADTIAELQNEQKAKEELESRLADLVKLLRKKDAVDAVTRQRRRTLPGRILHKRASSVKDVVDDKRGDLQRIVESVKDTSDGPLQDSLTQLSIVLDAEEEISKRLSDEDKAADDRVAAAEARAHALEAELTRAQRKHVRTRSQLHNQSMQSMHTKLQAFRLEQKAGRAKSSGGLRFPVVPRRLSGYRNWQQQQQQQAANTQQDSQSANPSRRSSLDLIGLPTIATGVDLTQTSGQRFSEPISRDNRPRAGTFSKRTSSLAAQAVLSTPAHQPPAEEALLVELVAAKTREATAILERDEMKQQLDRMRRLLDAQAAEAQAKLDSVEKMMAAQMEAHAAELRAARNNPTPGGIASLSSSRATTGGVEIGNRSPRQSPVGTPELVAPKSGGWFWGGRRTASTSTAALKG